MITCTSSGSVRGKRSLFRNDRSNQVAMSAFQFSETPYKKSYTPSMATAISYKCTSTEILLMSSPMVDRMMSSYLTRNSSRPCRWWKNVLVANEQSPSCRDEIACDEVLITSAAEEYSCVSGGFNAARSCCSLDGCVTDADADADNDDDDDNVDDELVGLTTAVRASCKASSTPLMLPRPVSDRRPIKLRR
jgi:hypothetical protein